MTSATTEALQARIVDLEIRLAFQEQALQALSDALAAARSEESRNALLLHRMRDELLAMRQAVAAGGLGIDPATEPPPPHY